LEYEVLAAVKKATLVFRAVKPCDLAGGNNILEKRWQPPPYKDTQGRKPQDQLTNKEKMKEK
jgi:hypothetical protein